MLVSPRARSLSSEAGSPGLQLIIVRHGQSTNNLIQDQVEKRMREEGLLAADAERIWLTERVHDPGLSEKGHAEAAAAGAELLRYLGPERGRAALVVLSPMLRALQTAAPIVAALASHRRGLGEAEEATEALLREAGRSGGRHFSHEAQKAPHAADPPPLGAQRRGRVGNARLLVGGSAADRPADAAHRNAR